MKNTIATALLIFTFSTMYSQWLGNYWTADDMNGNTHVLQNHINEGKAVLVDISAHWCAPCYSLHESHSMSNVYHDFGPNGTDEVMVFLTDVDAASSISILQGVTPSQGDWITGTPQPIIGPNGQGAIVDGYYTTPGVPTLYLHCMGNAPEISTTYDWWSLLSTIKRTCPSAFSFCGPDATLLKHDGVAGCPDGYYVELDLYNASSNTALTSAEIELRNPSGQLIATQNWTGNLAPFNRTTVTINHSVSNPGVYKAKVINPNGVTDLRPNGDEEEINVNFGYSNAYWAAPISISVSGTNTTSWYLKQNSTNGVVASGFGGASNYPANINPNECYTLLILQGDNQTFSITDGASNNVAQGTVSGEEYKSNFSAGTDPWNSLETIPNTISVYPIPTNDKLYIEGDFDYLNLIDINGKKVLKSLNVNSLDVSNLKSGVYLLEILNGDKKYRHNIQITR